MALKDIWTNKVNDQDFVDADDINLIAESVIKLEETIPKVKSPTISISAIDGGHRITITDVDGTKIFDVMDGEDGYTPVRGTDYWTEEDIATIKGYVDEAILGGAW